MGATRNQQREARAPSLARLLTASPSPRWRRCGARRRAHARVWRRTPWRRSFRWLVSIVARRERAPKPKLTPRAATRDHQALGDPDGCEQRHSDHREHDDHREHVGGRGLIAVGEDQVAEPARRPDPLGEDGADHGEGRGHAEPGEEVGQRERDPGDAEDLPATGPQRAQQPDELAIGRAETVDRVDCDWKKLTSAITITRGRMSKPVQRMTTGAIAGTGTIW